MVCSFWDSTACSLAGATALDRLPRLLAATIAVFLGLFSTRIPVYDGERLFLHVFPAWAMLIGLGFSRIWQRWGTGHARRILLSGFLLAQGFGTLALHPFELSYYNLLTGGLAGAEKLGLELTYWSDAVDRGAAGPACEREPAWRDGGPCPHALSRAGNPHDHGSTGEARDHPSG